MALMSGETALKIAEMCKAEKQKEAYEQLVKAGILKPEDADETK